jgi:hypothetical protein
MVQYPSDADADNVTSVLRIVLVVALCNAVVATLVLTVLPFH